MAFNALTAKRYWNAATNSPFLVPGRGENGDAYLVTVAGSSDLGQQGDWNVGDIAYFALDRWVRINSSNFERATSFDTIAQLKAYRGSATGVLVTQNGRGGNFAWRSGNCSASVADDPNQGIWVAPNSDPTGVSGAWERISERSYFHPKHYGVLFGANDDTAAMQACINAAQKVKGTILIPADRLAVLHSGLFIGVGGTDQTCHFLSSSWDPSAGSYSGNPYQFIGMGGFKLKDGSNTHLFTIHEDAAPPTFKGINFDGNKSGQSGESWVIYCPDAADAAGHYRWSVQLDHCHVNSGRSGAVYTGTFRGGLLAEKTWFQYNSTTTTDAAVRVVNYDVQVDMCGFGANAGIGLDLVSGTQIQMSHNVFWQNYQNVVIGPGVGDVGFVGDVFDQASDHGVVVNGATASYAHGARTFTGCKWRRNSAAADNAKSDLYVNGDARILVIAPDFQGKHAEANGPKYNIETAGAANVQLIAYNYLGYGGGVGYGMAFTNDWAKITPATDILQTFADPSYVYLGGNINNESLRVRKNNGDPINAWIDIEATNFGFAMVRAQSTGSNAKVVLFGKGTGGTQIEVSGGYLTFFGGAVVTQRTISGNLTAVTDANVKAILTAMLTALGPSGYNLIVDGTT